MTQYQPPPMPGPTGPEDPGRTLGIVGFVLSFFTALVGMIISIIALRRSKAAGFKNGFALAGIIIGVVTTVIGLIITSVLIVGVVALSNRCKDLGPGVHTQNGVTYTCPG